MEYTFDKLTIINKNQQKDSAFESKYNIEGSKNATLFILKQDP